MSEKETCPKCGSQDVKVRGVSNTFTEIKCAHCGYPVGDDWREKKTVKPTCPLCALDLKNEKVYYADDLFVVIQTKDLKGHKERIMIVSNEHRHDISFKALESALDILDYIGRKVFKYATKFVVMDSTFATINEHWHLVATDLDPKTNDFGQILKTKWLKVKEQPNNFAKNYYEYQKQMKFATLDCLLLL